MASGLLKDSKLRQHGFLPTLCSGLGVQSWLPSHSSAQLWMTAVQCEGAHHTCILDSLKSRTIQLRAWWSVPIPF